MGYDHSAAPLIPRLRLREDGVLVEITTLDAALDFARRHKRDIADYEGMIRRLQCASRTEDIMEAGDAFNWWAQSCGLLVEDTPRGNGKTDGKTAR